MSDRQLASGLITGLYWNQQHDQSLCQAGERTPVQAVPAKAHARGSKYQGAMAMRYKLAATDDKVMATALHAFQGFMSNTWKQSA